MTTAKSAQAKRDEAARTRRLAGTFPLDADRQRLLQYAEELGLQAEALERLAGPTTPLLSSGTGAGPVEQQQQGEPAANDAPTPGKTTPGN